MRIIYILFSIFVVLIACCDNQIAPSATDNENEIAVPFNDEAPNCVYLYMSPDGHDSCSATKENPVATFERVEEILEARCPDSTVIIRMYADRGIYIDYNTVWEYYNPNHITIFRAYPDTLHAIFLASEDNPPDVILFRFEAADGQPSNIRLERFSVRNYVRGVFAFYGDNEDPDNGWNGNNIVRDCIFRDIGTLRKPEYEMCYGVVVFVNSQSNKIMQCDFVNVANWIEYGSIFFPQGISENSEREMLEALTVTRGQVPIGVYIAHNSCYNLITGCRAFNIMGDMIRLRDHSNENVIENNYFIKAGWTGIITMWYCIPEYDTCRKIAPECPSMENVFKNNIIKGNWECGFPRIFFDMRLDDTGGCPRPIEYLERIHLMENIIDVCPSGTGSHDDIHYD